MDTATNPASRYGPVAVGEYNGAAEVHRPALAAWLDALPTLSDEDFLDAATSAIHDSALVQRFRGNWEHEHCKASAAYAEAVERHRAAGHTEHCTGDTLYSRAFARAWRSAGHDPNAYPPRRCDCSPG